MFACYTKVDKVIGEKMRVAVSRVASVKPRRFMSTASDLIVTQNKNLLQIELNRPKALNALSNEMVHEIKNILTTKINTPESTVGAFVVKGNGGKAFCAGSAVMFVARSNVF